MSPNPASSRPAPGDLVVVQEFVNTLDIETGEDRLADPKSAQDWLVEYGLMRRHEQLDAETHRRLLRVREAIRALLLAHTRGEPDSEALSALNAQAAQSPLVVSFETADSSHLTATEGGAGGAMGRLFAIIHRSMVDGSFVRLKACLNDECHWAFYDHSKNRSGNWCSMAVCGSRMKARAYRQRQGKDAG